MKSMTSLGGLVRNTSDALSGNWWRSVAVIMIAGFLLYGLQMWIFAGQMQWMLHGFTPVGIGMGASGIVLLALFCGPLMTGGAFYFLSVAKNESPSVGSVFWGLDHFGRSIGVFWLTALLVLLWTLLLAAIMLGLFFGLGALTGAAVLPTAAGGNAVTAAGSMGLVMLVPMIVWMGGLLWIFFRHSLIWFAFAENPDAGVIAAVRRGIAAVRGNIGKLFGAWFLMFLAVLLLAVVLAVCLFFLTAAGQPVAAMVFNLIVALVMMMFFYIFPPAFLAVLYADCKDTA